MTRVKTAFHANAMVVWRGPSELDGSPIVLVATGLSRASNNAKTGDMIQTWILREDMSPNQAVKTGADSAVCGDCPLRPFLKDTRPKYLRKPCYVVVFRAPTAIWRAHHDRPVSPPETVRARIGQKKVRRGSYGDPAAVPAHIWELLQNTKQDTGYSHQWRDAPDELARSVMASVHTREEAREAWARGFRTFRVVDSVTDLIPGREIVCPASKEAGMRTTCERCGLCNGSTGPDDKRKNILIQIHP